jgi:hypothetical protein
MFIPRGLGVPEQHDDPFASYIESLIFPVSQTARFDFSAFAAGHQNVLPGLQEQAFRLPDPGGVTDAISVSSTSESADITVQPLEAGALTFALHNIGGITPGSQAEAGFLRAAALWQSFLGDPVTVRLDVGFSSLGPGILGSTNSASKVVSYSAVRTALTADQTSSDDMAAVASLSPGSSLAFFTNNSAGTRVFDSDGSANNTFLNVSTADLKALGLTTDTGAADGSITFSSNFTWDFDPSDGITTGAIDFVGVAFHEIGHALGFISGVDVVDANTGAGPGGQVNLNSFAIFSVLDLFRYSSPGARDLSFGGSTYFSLNGGATNLALFSTGRFQGDGRQASHWKDNLGIGIMDPTSVPAGQANVITSRDIQALDVIGWNRVGTQGPSPGSISISDMQIIEGDAGTKVGTFTVTRTGGTAAFAVNFATSDGTATTADNDYFTNAGTLNFAAGVNTQTISVTINGDTKLENSETFSVNLSGATNGAVISDNSALGTIANDEGTRSPHEFNGDGKNDFLWRNDSGVVATWDMNDRSSSGAVIAGVSNDWHIADTGDFNGDGKSDILWRNDSGAVATWNMNDRSANGAVIANVSNDWHIAGTGDFNGDGKTDILWRNDSGAVATWNMNDRSYSGLVIANVSNDWHIAGTGDFNGDGKTDILWRNDSGAVATWDMNDRSSNGAVIATVTNDWHIAETGDFNGDHKTDILWRNDDGAVATWDMNDRSYSDLVIATTPNDWHIV